MNSQVSDDPFHLSVIEYMILSQERNSWSVFDLEDEFHQMHLAPESRQYPANLTPCGLCKWLVLPMGVKRAPKAYQRMVPACLDTGFWGKTSLAKRFCTKSYIDNLLPGTPDRDNSGRSEQLSGLCIEDHERQLQELFGILAYCKLSLKPKRCQMFVIRVK